MISCSECDSKLTIKQPKVGQLIVCPNCAVELEVVSAYPIDPTAFLVIGNSHQALGAGFTPLRR